jgi:hypothetical protein
VDHPHDQLLECSFDPSAGRRTATAHQQVVLQAVSPLGHEDPASPAQVTAHGSSAAHFTLQEPQVTSQSPLQVTSQLPTLLQSTLLPAPVVTVHDAAASQVMSLPLPATTLQAVPLAHWKTQLSPHSVVQVSMLEQWTLQLSPQLVSQCGMLVQSTAQ